MLEPASRFFRSSVAATLLLLLLSPAVLATPLIQPTTILSQGIETSYFGVSLAINGDTLAVGASGYAFVELFDRDPAIRVARVTGEGLPTWRLPPLFMTGASARTWLSAVTLWPLERSIYRALPGSGGSLLQDRYETIDDFSDLHRSEIACAVQDQSSVRGEDPVRPHVARLLQAAGSEVRVSNGNCVTVLGLLAGDLAEDQIVTVEPAEHEGWPPFCVRKVGEGKGDDDDISLYKPCHASSSSGRSQSRPRTGSLA